MPTNVRVELEEWVSTEIAAREIVDHPTGGTYYYDLFSTLVPTQQGLATMLGLSISAKSPIIGQWLGASLMIALHPGMTEVEVKEFVANILNELNTQKMKAFAPQNGKGITK